jgi:hypothetical protein
VKPSVEHGFTYKSTARNPRADHTRKDVVRVAKPAAMPVPALEQDPLGTQVSA